MLVAPHSYELAPDRCAAPPLEIGAIFKEHHSFVWRVLGHMGVAPGEQEDAMQEVFVVVHRRLAEYRDQDKMRAWLYAICSRIARDYRRRLFRRREQLSDTLPDTPLAASQVADVSNRQALEVAKGWLQSLPKKQREVFLLYEVEQMPMAEVAVAVGCPLPTAYARLKKARERLLAQVARARFRGEAP